MRIPLPREDIFKKFRKWSYMSRLSELCLTSWYTVPCNSSLRSLIIFSLFSGFTMSFTAEDNPSLSTATILKRKLD